MADSDIQFLGNWNSHQGSPNSAFVSAIVLSPMDGSPPRTYSRAQTSVVHIGRIPSADNRDIAPPRPPPEETAGFTDPVMSRDHAKVTFADSGSAFIIDTSSRHGTWVSRPASTKPKFRLAAESPYMLLDGDRVTFGKEVTKDGIKHQPLTVSIKLLRANLDISTSAPATGPSTTLNTSPKPRNRFGLDHSSDSDSSEGESIYDKPGTGANAIRVELPLKSFRPSESEPSNRILMLPSPSSSSSIESSPANKQKEVTSSPQHSPELPPSDFIGKSPAHSGGTQPDHQPPGLELSRTTDLPEGIQDNLPSLPPWRCFGSGVSDLISPGLEISGTGKRYNLSRILDATPPFPFPRHPETLIPAINPLDDTSAVVRQQQSLRFSQDKPLWMSANHVERDGDGPEIGKRLFNMFRTHGRHRNSDERLGHDGRHRRSRVFREMEAMPMDEDGPADKVSNQAISNRLDELKAQLIAVRDTTSSLQNSADKEKINELETTLDSLSTSVSALKGDVVTVQDDVYSFNVDTSALRVEFATLREGFNAGNTLLREDFERLRGEVQAIPSSVDVVVQDFDAFKSEYSGFRSEVERLQTEFQELKSEIGRIDSVVTGHMKGWEENTVQRIRQEIQASNERLPSSGGQRKRSYDEAFESNSEHVPSASAQESRNFKRLRLVADFAAASVLGAFGAYLGLAYLGEAPV